MVECFFSFYFYFCHLFIKFSFWLSTYLIVYLNIYRIDFFIYLFFKYVFSIHRFIFLFVYVLKLFFYSSIHDHRYPAACATKNTSVHILFKSPIPAIIFENATKTSHFHHFSVDAQSTTTHHAKWRLNVQNVSETVHFQHF